MKDKNASIQLKNEISGCALIVIGIIYLLTLSLSSQLPEKALLGMAGEIINWLSKLLLGQLSILLPLGLIYSGISLLLGNELEKLLKLGKYYLLFIISLCFLGTQIETWLPKLFYYISPRTSTPPTSLMPHPNSLPFAGLPFKYLYIQAPTNLYNLIGDIGCFTLFTSLLITSMMGLTQTSLSNLIASIKSELNRYISKISQRKNRITVIETNNQDLFNETEDEIIDESDSELAICEAPIIAEEAVEAEEAEDEPKKNTPKNAIKNLPAQQKTMPMKMNYKHYKLPSNSLITPPKKVSQSAYKKTLKEQARILEETLSSFGIEARVDNITLGPRITLFEITPASGVKVQKITALENDIALNLKATSIRIIAPIPGKAAVGIEVPNPQPQEVGFRDLMDAYHASSKKFQVPLLLGKAVNGDNVLTDLTKMPHLIIAGATGSGKSVCVNTIIMSILMNRKPDEVRMIMVDPKKVELTPYTSVPHMLAPVITEPKEASKALTWLVHEMERRYEYLKLTGSRNIIGYNQQRPQTSPELVEEHSLPEKLPYIICFIDELADLMMVATEDIETPIARIAQMARAVGIHLVLATQRPSREVLTGLIKANFPTRIAFKVSSRVNSQIILDENGAESLLGNGDCLFLPPGTSSLIRLQGAFIHDLDINKVISFACSQAHTDYTINSFVEALGSNTSTAREDLDPLFGDAKDLVIKTNTASTTFLQRKLRVGYARAASLMDQLEDEGVVGKPDGSRARVVLANQ